MSPHQQQSFCHGSADRAFCLLAGQDIQRPDPHPSPAPIDVLRRQPTALWPSSLRSRQSRHPCDRLVWSDTAVSVLADGSAGPLPYTLARPLAVPVARRASWWRLCQAARVVSSLHGSRGAAGA